MNATPSPHEFQSVDRTRITDRKGSPRMSSGKFSDREAVTSYRRFYAKRWQRFITENFESPAHAAMVFKVDPTTAQNWFDGLNAPQGWVVGYALSKPEMRDAALHHIAAE